MMTVWSRARLCLGRITFKSCLNGCAPSVSVNVGFGRRLRIYMPNIALTMTRTCQQLTISIRWFRIGFIMQLQDRLQPKLCITMRIIPKCIWAWQLGKLSRWTCLEIWCLYCKELSAREKDKGIGTCRISILWLYWNPY